MNVAKNKKRKKEREKFETFSHGYFSPLDGMTVTPHTFSSILFLSFDP
jgi:hypothetical protein